MISWIFQNNNFNKYFFAANLTTLLSGISMGWSSPAIPILSSKNTPLESGIVSNEEISWIGSSYCIGGLFTTLSYNFVSDLIGRKKAIQLIALPLFVNIFLNFIIKGNEAEKIILLLLRILTIQI